MGLLSVFRDFRSHFLRSLLRKSYGNINAARYVLRITIILTLCLCIIFSFFVFWYAELICSVFLHEPSCVPCLRLAVLVLPFVGIKTVFMGTALELRIRVFLLFLCVWNRFQGYPLSFTFCIHDRENASSCFSSCLWNDCWGDRFIFFTLIFYFLHKSLLTACQSLLFLHQNFLYFMNCYPLGFH